MKILKQDIKTEKLIDECMMALKRGELLVLPSDTVYGLIVDAQNEKAVSKLIAFKDRPVGKAISVFVEGIDNVSKYVDVKESQLSTIEKLAPGPFTFILSSKQKLDSRLESEQKTLGVRFPKFAFIQKLVEAYGSPITATSANLASKGPHYSIKALLNTLSEKKKGMLELIVDFGELPHNKPSTVIDLTTTQVRTLRQGDISIDSKEYISHSPEETKKIAQELFSSLTNTDKPLIILLEGELGVGKTIFTKGIGEMLGITRIDSPSFIIYNEYKLNKKGFKTLIHGDLYNVQDENEFDHLGLEEYLQKGTILIFEWGEKIGTIYNRLKEKGSIVFVKMEYINKVKRKIIINRIT